MINKNIFLDGFFIVLTLVVMAPIASNEFFPTTADYANHILAKLVQ